MTTSNLLYMALGSGVVALLFAWWKTQWINKQDAGTDRMKEIGAAVREGAMAFLSREYKVLSIFVVVVACLLAFRQAAHAQYRAWGAWGEGMNISLQCKQME